jgi:hypothetical protein
VSASHGDSHGDSPPSWRPPSWRSRGTASASAAEGDGFFTVDLDLEDYGAASDESDDEDSPWEGALVYRRDAAVHHLEHATTLERLGLGDLSSPDSPARANAMGMGPPDQPHTPSSSPSTSPAAAPACASTASCAPAGRPRGSRGAV